MTGMSSLLLLLSSFLFGTHSNLSVRAPSIEYLVELRAWQYSGFHHDLKDLGVGYTLRRISTTDYYRLSLPSDEERWLDQMVHDNLLEHWQHDRPVVKRNTPNDPLFPSQWDLIRIGMPEAWNRATGGTTMTGDTIVVAVLDAGFDVNHEDLRDNLWANRKEIPGDGIDNDQNGYVDDYLGLNIQTGDDQHDPDTHGTAVAGIIGGREKMARASAGSTGR